ncbi:NAD(P)-dependent oxidoreductase [Acerihabitans sp.]|uniref:NAD-dependent epimerase/dehydratase family protein n=1 Tax=Acerihabitans sp. TaxID=2811394 RepID=UPI002ED8BA08
MTILITGATGMVGARLLPRLVDTGVDCRALVRNDAALPAGVTPVKGDIFDSRVLEQAVTGVSAIIHLAAVFRTEDTDLIWKSNVEGTRRLIAAAQACAPKARFILASTSNVYNLNNPHPGREEDEVSPDHAYPASKVAAENELRKSGLNWIILRFPFIYGDADGHLDMLSKMAVANKMHPASKISTLHHSDIATAMTLALSGGMDGQLVNIADEATTSIYELIKLVGGEMPPSSEPLSNPWHLHIDASLARTLGFQPKIRTVYQAEQEGLL